MSGMLTIQVISILIVFFIYRLYHQRRAVSRVDEFYAVFGAVSIGTMMSVAITALAFKNSVLDLDFSRAMIVYAWLLTIALVMLGAWFTTGSRDARERRVGGAIAY